jgi:hypothetical protein
MPFSSKLLEKNDLQLEDCHIGVLISCPKIHYIVIFMTTFDQYKDFLGKVEHEWKYFAVL